MKEVSILGTEQGTTGIVLTENDDYTLLTSKKTAIRFSSLRNCLDVVQRYGTSSVQHGLQLPSGESVSLLSPTECRQVANLRRSILRSPISKAQILRWEWDDRVIVSRLVSI